MILGLNHWYFRGDGDDPLLKSKPLKESDLPNWACLDCSPRWLELHALMLPELEFLKKMEEALMAMEFETAAKIRDERSRFAATYHEKVDHLIESLLLSPDVAKA